MSPFVEVALLTSIGSSAFAGAVLAQAAAPDANIAPYVGGGAGLIAVGALAEVTRRLMNGRLIARETKDIEEELGAAIVAAGQREATAMLHAESMRRTAEEMLGEMKDQRDEMRRLRKLIEEMT